MRIRYCLAALAFAGGAALTTVPTPAASAAVTAAACTDIDVVAARGTFEPGTLGAIVGDPVYSALQRKLTGKSLSSYKVDYPADLSLTSAAQGNSDLVDQVRSQAASCPSQRFILVGYSQGANVVDNSVGISSAGAVVGSPIVATIPAALEPRVAALLLFGNPIRAIGKSVTGTYQSRTIDFCAEGDPICENGGDDVLAHLGYTANAGAAADFAATKV
ncbi:cutinase family protein [Streptomyces sp. NPDC002680]|uniref:cutinase family protein n=1 Tax=Streptomyces sp. NPDC002680 TaxID=3364659 RepID=UPI0036AC3D2C